MLKSIKLINFIIQGSQKENFQIKVEVVLIAAFISLLGDFQNPDRKTVKAILKMLDGKNIVFRF